MHSLLGGSCRTFRCCDADTGDDCRSRRFYDNWRNDALVRSLALKGAR